MQVLVFHCVVIFIIKEKIHNIFIYLIVGVVNILPHSRIIVVIVWF